MQEESNMENKKSTVVNTKKRSRTAYGYAAAIAALTLAVAIPLNLLASRLNVIWDMTPSKLYELSDTTKKYLDNLDLPDDSVNFYFLMDMDYLATDDDSMALYYTLKQYSEYDTINFVDFDPDTNAALMEELNPDGYLNLSIGDMIIQYGDNVRHIPANTMYQYEVSYDDDGNSTVEAAYFTGENYITGAIDAVVSGRDTTVYFLSGHGEKTLENDYTTFYANLVNYNYTALSLNLSTADAVPDDAALIIVAAPQSDLTNSETKLLNDYLDNGGNVTFLMSPNKAEIRYKNIESILEDYGLGMDYDIVYETDSDLHVSDDPYTYQVSIVASDEDYGTNLTDELVDMTDSGYYAFMSNSRSFYQYSSSTDTSLQIESLLQTVSTTDELGNSVSTAVGKVYGGTDDDAEDITGVPLDLAMYSTSTSRGDSKIVVFGNAEFIDDDNVSQDYMIIPVYLMLTTITWMYNSDLDMDMGIADKERDYDSLVLNSESIANTVAIVFIAVPTLVALSGTIVWLKRRYS
jgi:hypothetical protein